MSKIIYITIIIIIILTSFFFGVVYSSDVKYNTKWIFDDNDSKYMVEIPNKLN